MSKKTVNNVTLDCPDIDSKQAEIKIGTVLRLGFLVAAYTNQVCEVVGAYDAYIPTQYKAMVTTVSVIATAVASVCAYWFNNSWSNEAKVADKMLATIREASRYCPEIVDAVNATIEEFTSKTESNTLAADSINNKKDT